MVGDLGDACCLARLGLLYGLLAGELLPVDVLGLAKGGDAGGRPREDGDLLPGDLVGSAPAAWLVAVSAVIGAFTATLAMPSS